MSIGVSIRCSIVVGPMFLSRIFVKKLQGRLCYRCLFPAAQCSVLSWCLRVGCFSELRCVRLPEPSAVMNGLIHFNSKSCSCKGKVLGAEFCCSECPGSQEDLWGSRREGSDQCFTGEEILVASGRASEGGTSLNMGSFVLLQYHKVNQLLCIWLFVIILVD